MRDPTSNARLVGIGFVVAGFVLIALGWYGAARLDYVQGQVPYLISGGVGGLGSIGAGIALLILHESRVERRALNDKLDRLLDALGHAAPVGNGNGNGSRRRGDVVLGSSTFHRSDCRLVAGRDDLPTADPAEAAARELRPCRICQPATADA